MNAVKSGSIQLYCPYGTMREVVEVIQTHQNDNVRCGRGGLELTNYRPLPSTCHYTGTEGMDAKTKAAIDNMFKSECLNRGYCNLPLRQLTMFPDQFCRTGYNYTQMLYFMQVKCVKDQIKVFDALTLPLDKNIIGYIVVAFDILIVLIIYLMISFLGSNIDIVKGEVD